MISRPCAGPAVQSPPIWLGLSLSQRSCLCYTAGYRPPPCTCTRRRAVFIYRYMRNDRISTDHRPPTTDHRSSITDGRSPLGADSRQSSVVSGRSSAKDFRAGFVAMLPLWMGAAPFGAIYAVTALAAGLTPAQTLAMSLLVFAGAAQFTAAGLFASAATPLTIVVTTLVVNARHMLLAASLAPYVRRSPAWVRALLAFHLTDESYAIGMRAFLDGTGSPAYQL